MISNTILSHLLLTTDEATNFRTFLRSFRRREVLFDDERILWNINTREDYTRYLSNLKADPT